MLRIEDDPANLKRVSKLIKKRRHHPAQCRGTGNRYCLAVEHKPALIPTDINLPEMNGYEVLRHLREMAETHGISVIALSANAMAEDLQRGEAAGFDGYLTKPLNVEEFFGVVEWMLG